MSSVDTVAVRASTFLLHHHQHHKIDRFYAGLVHEIAGPAGSGKSELCHHELISYLHASPGQALIIDTSGTFSPRRMADLIKSRAGDERMLDRVQITRCLNIYGVLDALHELQSSFSLNADPSARIGIVLVDAITSPISRMMQRGQSAGHDLMVNMLRDLTWLSRRGLCVLLVNGTVRADRKVDDDTVVPVQRNADTAFAQVAVKPALGHTFPHLIDYTLFIYPVPEGTRKMPGKRGYIQEVTRSRISVVGDWEVV